MVLHYSSLQTECGQHEGVLQEPSLRGVIRVGISAPVACHCCLWVDALLSPAGGDTVAWLFLVSGTVMRHDGALLWGWGH